MLGKSEPESRIESARPSSTFLDATPTPDDRNHKRPTLYRPSSCAPSPPRSFAASLPLPLCRPYRPHPPSMKSAPYRPLRCPLLVECRPKTKVGCGQRTQNPPMPFPKRALPRRDSDSPGLGSASLHPFLPSCPPLFHLSRKLPPRPRRSRRSHPASHRTRRRAQR